MIFIFVLLGSLGPRCLSSVQCLVGYTHCGRTSSVLCKVPYPLPSRYLPALFLSFELFLFICYYFCRLKGVSPKDEKAHVQEWLIELGLTFAADRPSSSLSGGMKRRYSAPSPPSLTTCSLRFTFLFVFLYFYVSFLRCNLQISF